MNKYWIHYNNRMWNLLFVGVVLLVSNSHAQERETVVVRDIEAWTKLSAEFELHKKFEIGLTQALRLEHNASQLNQLFTELSFTYKPVKKLNIGSEFRLSQSKQEDGFEHKLRFASFLIAKHKANRTSFRYRIQYQVSNELGEKIAEGDDLVHQLRTRFAIGYNFKSWKVDPKLSFELFNKFEDKEASFDRFRLKLDSDYAFKKVGSLGFFVAYERDLKKEYPKNTTIIGLSYDLSFKKKKKKEKEDAEG